MSALQKAFGDVFRFAQTVQKSSEWTVLKGVSDNLPTDYPNESAEISHIDYKRTPCAYCNILGHKEQQCRKKTKVQLKIKQERKSWNLKTAMKKM